MPGCKGHSRNAKSSSHSHMSREVTAAGMPTPHANRPGRTRRRRPRSRAGRGGLISTSWGALVIRVNAHEEGSVAAFVVVNGPGAEFRRGQWGTRFRRETKKNSVCLAQVRNSHSICFGAAAGSPSEAAPPRIQEDPAAGRQAGQPPPAAVGQPLIRQQKNSRERPWVRIR